MHRTYTTVAQFLSIEPALLSSHEVAAAAGPVLVEERRKRIVVRNVGRPAVRGSNCRV
jgi:hypothetical protein